MITSHSDDYKRCLWRVKPLAWWIMRWTSRREYNTDTPHFQFNYWCHYTKPRLCHANKRRARSPFWRATDRFLISVIPNVFIVVSHSALFHHTTWPIHSWGERTLLAGDRLNMCFNMDVLVQGLWKNVQGNTIFLLCNVPPNFLTSNNCFVLLFKNIQIKRTQCLIR
jgi:hypothetical protein